MRVVGRLGQKFNIVCPATAAAAARIRARARSQSVIGRARWANFFIISYHIISLTGPDAGAVVAA